LFQSSELIASPDPTTVPASPMVRSRRATLLPFFFLVAAARLFGFVVGLQAEDTARSSGHHPPLLDCAPAPPADDDDRAFRADLTSALGALPSAAAAAPGGFATTRSGGRAFARGLCFGANASSSPAAARACRACLTAAARDVASSTGGCGASRRAGVWRAGCFLAYADTDAPSAREDAFRGWFYAGPNTTTTLADRACAGEHRAAAGCARCFEDAARAAAALGWLARIRGQEVLVVGYGCALRVRISVLPQGSDCEFSYTIPSPALAQMLDH
jgi:hypothetical protein